MDCPEETEWESCPSGFAVKYLEEGTDDWDTTITIYGWDYRFYAEYVCKDSSINF